MTERPEGNGGEERVSTLAGDRLCTRCAYNLTGQPVVREGHYRMLIVRCPECGTVASVQEYPILGHWTGRWAAVLAAAWFGVTLALVLGAAGMLTGVTGQISGEAAARFTGEVGQFQNERFQQLRAQGNNRPTNWQVTADEVRAMADAAGGWWRVTDWQALRGWAWLGPLVLATGCVLATFFLHLRRPGLLLLGLLVLLLAAGFALLGRQGGWYAYGYMYAPNGAWLPAWQLMYDRINRPIMFLSLAFCALPLVAGLWFGRPIVRSLLRALLHPRLRSALALLWISDGLEPPRGHRRGASR